MALFSIRNTALAATLALMPNLALAEANAGAYLAGRLAEFDKNYEESARFYTRALIGDPDNPAILESTAIAFLSLGRIDQALPIAEKIESQGSPSQVAGLIKLAGLAQKEDYDTIIALKPAGDGFGLLMDGLVEAWAQLGAGSVSSALEGFDVIAEQEGLRGFALYHKALALARIGNFEAADAVFSDDAAARVMMTRRGTLARVEILSQLGRNEDALEVMKSVFGAYFDPALQDVYDKLEAGEKLPFTHVQSVKDGIAEVFFSLGSLLAGEAVTDYALVHAQIATYLRPDMVDGLLLTAQLLDGQRQFDLAIDTYKRVPRTSPDFHAAEQGRADSLRRADKIDAAREVLEGLARDFPDMVSVHTALGNLARQQEDFDAATDAYDKAIALTIEQEEDQWSLYYVRGISNERQDNWTAAERDFRKALELSPGQPQVLNYLGYSMVEQRTNLDEALAMIEEAVAAQPGSGYIVDSLGWVYYRLGRYEEAVGQMEKAVELMPVDPVVNDHLGDVYWAVGRYLEAEFQWKRALSFVDPDDTNAEADPDRIRRKLEVGLDAVLAEEGADPLKVANEDG